MSEIKTNKISPRKGTTTTITDSGDTVTVTSGANINNAGTLTINNLTNSGTLTSTGTLTTAGISGGTINNTTGTIEGLQQQVSWQTGSIKTTAFTASANEGYFLNTTSGEITVTLPASPAAGDVVAVKDYADTFDTNKAILNPNGNKIQGVTTNFHITVEGTAAIFLYIDSTQGWKLVDQSKAADIAEGPSFTTATGGTITTSGNCKIHTFTGPGTFTVVSLGNGPTVPTGGPVNFSYLTIAGGASGGNGSHTEGGGGGGAGGFRTISCTPLTVQGYPVTVGAGGAAISSTPTQSQGNDGSNSVFSTTTSAGGGGGGAGNGSSPFPGINGRSGGSGGGGSTGHPAQTFGGTGGSGNQPPVNPSQGNPGGASPANGPTDFSILSAGGGGAGGTGSNSGNFPGGTAGNGGNGSASSITGSPVTYAGGGGGGGNPSYTPQGGTGGPGGGGGGGPTAIGSAGTANTGGGGGGAGNGCAGYAGGSGVVIIKYRYQ